MGGYTNYRHPNFNRSLSEYQRPYPEDLDKKRLIQGGYHLLFPLITTCWLYFTSVLQNHASYSRLFSDNYADLSDSITDHVEFPIPVKLWDIRLNTLLCPTDFADFPVERCKVRPKLPEQSLVIRKGHARRRFEKSAKTEGFSTSSLCDLYTSITRCIALLFINFKDF